MKPQIGDAARFMGHAATITGVGVDVTGAPNAVMEYQLSERTAAARPRVTLVPKVDAAGEPVLGPTGKQELQKVEDEWPADVPRFARTTCYQADLRWDGGHHAWVLVGVGEKLDGVFYSDTSHPDNLHAEREG
jgi:hypothetical protein